MSDAAWVTLGKATAHGQVLPLGAEDPVIAARAVRRALAAASRRAMDVQAMALASSIAVTPDALARFARRALGPHGSNVELSAAHIPGDVEALADHAALLVTDLRAAAGGVAIAVGLAADGTSEARCLGLAAPASRPRPLHGSDCGGGQGRP